MKLLLKYSAKLVLIALMIEKSARMVEDVWLVTFAYRTSLSPMTFYWRLLSGGVHGTCNKLQAIRLPVNPVESLKDEMNLNYAEKYLPELTLNLQV